LFPCSAVFLWSLAASSTRQRNSALAIRGAAAGQLYESPGGPVTLFPSNYASQSAKVAVVNDQGAVVSSVVVSLLPRLLFYSSSRSLSRLLFSYPLFFSVAFLFLFRFFSAVVRRLPSVCSIRT
jgi:hypothetical protein